MREVARLKSSLEHSKLLVVQEHRKFVDEQRDHDVTKRKLEYRLADNTWLESEGTFPIPRKEGCNDCGGKKTHRPSCRVTERSEV